MVEVIPLNVGNLLTMEKSNFTYLKNHGVKFKAPCIMWYLKGTPENIIVDTGPSDSEWAALYHYPMERSEEQQVLPALASVGLRPRDVKLVINTHLHWDHCYGNTLFTEAKFLVQEKELDYARRPLPCHAHYYESQLPTQPFWGVMDRFMVVNGDVQLSDDVSVSLLPGHTPGMQAVVVEGQAARIIIAADMVPLFENLVTDPPIPHAIHVDLVAYYESLGKLRSLGGTILPGHDMRVFTQGAYPAKG